MNEIKSAYCRIDDVRALTNMELLEVVCRALNCYALGFFPWIDSEDHKIGAPFWNSCIWCDHPRGLSA